MTRHTLSFFETYYIDYRGCLRKLAVSFLFVSEEEFIHFQCTLDERDIYSIHFAADGRWPDEFAGPTVLADELGSLIEGQMFWKRRSVK